LEILSRRLEKKKDTDHFRQVIAVEVWDKDYKSSDELIGAGVLDFGRYHFNSRAKKEVTIPIK